MATEDMLLRDPEIYPADEVVENIVPNEVFTVYKKVYEIITSEEAGLTPEWNYYKDGKAWLCKVIYKKKTVFWLSVWKHFIKAGFYFTEKYHPGVMNLPISEELKQRFQEATPSGKLIPLILDMDKDEQLEDLKKIINYKKSLK
jgi:hypothetical protein